jgi:hypothetical protein
LGLAAHAHRQGRKLAVVWFGRGSAAAEQTWARVAAALEPQVRFVRVGAQGDRAASELLECCELGLPTVQFNLLGKSSAAAAFTEHGVPLLVVSDDWWPRFPGFNRSATDDSIVLWSPDTKIDWEEFLSARPEPGRLLAACVGAWREVLATGDGGLRSEPAPTLSISSPR